MPLRLDGDAERYTAPGDGELLERLRAGDEDAFRDVVGRFSPGMRRAVLAYVRDESVADEVVQDAWIGVLRGLAAFESRSSFRSWVFSIAINRAKTRGIREARTVPFSALAKSEAESNDPSVEPERFAGPGARWPGHWNQFPPDWGEAPDERLLRRESRERIDRAIDELPPAQRAVVVLKDVGNVTTGDVCNALGLSETNVRVLLHRGRAKIRRRLEAYFTENHQESA